jgi:hypothetical protein
MYTEKTLKTDAASEILERKESYNLKKRLCQTHVHMNFFPSFGL